MSTIPKIFIMAKSLRGNFISLGVIKQGVFTAVEQAIMFAPVISLPILACRPRSPRLHASRVCQQACDREIMNILLISQNS